MICVDSNGQAIEISVADQMWLDDAYFKGKQMHLEADAPRVALAYRVSTKGQVDHDDIPMQKIDCRKFAQKQGWPTILQPVSFALWVTAAHLYISSFCRHS